MSGPSNPTRRRVLVAGAFLAAFGLGAGSARAVAPPEEEEDTEFTLVPIAGGDSDIGFGGGYLMSWARKRQGLAPYAYGIESGGAITFRPEGKGLEVPYIDDYVRVSFPHLVRHQVGLEFRLSYTREQTLKYFGLGNASVIPAGREPKDDYFEYAHTHAAIEARLRRRLLSSVWLLVGLFYAHNWVDVPSASLLAEDRERGGKHGELLRSEGTHGVAQFSYGLEWDTRDSKVSPRHGQRHTARIDLAPGGVHALPYRYARINTAFTFFQELYPDRLVLALRAAGDALVGDVPFYELARFDRTYFGGGKAVRGVPAQRYYGKLKLLGNAELRTTLFGFTMFEKPYELGLIGIFDAGRVFTGYERDRKLDGSGLGLKYGVGGGLRLQAGKTFVLRADLVWSPDADPVGGYLAGGHVF